jgi:hypothetical protein
MKNLPRILQIIWMLVAAVAVFEAFNILTSDSQEKATGYLFIGVAVFAAVRYFMLRRSQYNSDKKNRKLK